jgi:short-subunit dehydrogenase
MCETESPSASPPTGVVHAAPIFSGQGVSAAAIRAAILLSMSATDRIVVITGASAGIGAALAAQVVKAGAIPVLVARRERELSEVAARVGGGAIFIVADVTRRSDVERVVAETLSRLGHIDVWVNNAGTGISRLVSELVDEDIDDMVRINVKAPLYGMQAVLPHFRTRGHGHIINVSSMLGRVPMAPVRSAYAAAKHALNALTANLRMELHDSDPGIRVSLILPGVVTTDFGLNAKYGGADSRAFPNAQSAEAVAAVILDVIEHPRAEAYTRPGAKKMVVDYFAAEEPGA